MADWIIPCDPDQYDLFGAFAALKTVDWRQWAKNIEKGDTVYIYASRPIQAVVFKCRVTETDISVEEVDGSDAPFARTPQVLSAGQRFMRLEPVRKYDLSDITFAKLKANGMKGNIQGQRRIDTAIREVIEAAEGDGRKG